MGACTNNISTKEKTSKKPTQEPYIDFNTSLKDDDNIYVEGGVFTYSYEFNQGNGKLNKEELKRIDHVVVEITRSRDDNYKDLYMSYSYPPEWINVYSGLVENNEKVWIHPPRQFFFKILELNPFPMIKKPYAIGQKWTNSLTIGEQYGDSRWREWKGNIVNESSYEIMGDTVLDSNLGKLQCYVIEATGESELGETSLTSYFNENYGFVKLDYRNIDGSVIVLELKKYEKKKRMDLGL